MQEEVFLWLENLGYNRQLQSVSTRSFVVSCHSESLFCLSVFERENSVVSV